jgi:hypothetical protein
MHSYSDLWIPQREVAASIIALFAVLSLACDDPSCPSDTAEIDGRCKLLSELNTAGTGAGGNGSTTPASMQPGTAGTEVNQGAAAMSGGESPNATAGTGAGSSGSGSPSMSMMDPRPAAAGNGPQETAGTGGMGTNGMSEQAPGCNSSSEVCDNLDNDCDGKTDEAVTRSCGSNAVGMCKSGVEACNAGSWGECIGAVTATDEVCDPENLDENCDGASNEGCSCTTGETRMCGDADGECRQGMQSCVDGAWSAECEGAVEPKTEVCDEAGVDEDCDGTSNEGCDCHNGQTEDCQGNNTAPCSAGTRSCTNGKWGTCTGVKPPQPENVTA